MNILTLISIEFKKIRRSHILPVLLAAGCGAGAAIGLLGGIITKRIRGLWESGV